MRPRMQHAGASSSQRRFGNLNKFWTQFQFSPTHTDTHSCVCVFVWRPAAHHQALSIKTFSACLALILIKCESGWEHAENMSDYAWRNWCDVHGRSQAVAQRKGRAQLKYIIQQLIYWWSARNKSSNKAVIEWDWIFLIDRLFYAKIQL